MTDKFSKLIILLLFLFTCLGDLFAQNKVLYLDNDRKALQVRIDRALEEGVTELNFATHIFRRDNMGLGTLAVLVHLAKKGVKIRFLIDYFEMRSEENFSLNPEWISYLQANNVEVRIYNKFSWKDFFKNPFGIFKLINQRMHIKIVTFNKDEAIVGGRNTSKNYFFPTRERRITKLYHQFLDRDVYVKGIDAVQAYDHFMEHWNSDQVSIPESEKLSLERITEIDLTLSKMFETIKTLKGRKDYSAEFFDVAKAEFFTDSPHKYNEIDGISSELLKEIKNAKESILIMNPYVLLTPLFMEALLDARNRNVKIKILTSQSSEVDMPIVGPEFERDLQKLLQIGDVFQEMNIKDFHPKVFVFDGKRTIISSYNLDSRSENYDTENGVVIDDLAFAEMVTQDFNKLISKAIQRKDLSKPKPKELPFPNFGEKARINSSGQPFKCIWIYKIKSRILRPLL